MYVYIYIYIYIHNLYIYIYIVYIYTRKIGSSDMCQDLALPHVFTTCLYYMSLYIQGTSAHRTCARTSLPRFGRVNVFVYLLDLFIRVCMCVHICSCVYVCVYMYVLDMCPLLHVFTTCLYYMSLLHVFTTCLY
jgi:hypothetical protein